MACRGGAGEIFFAGEGDQVEVFARDHRINNNCVITFENGRCPVILPLWLKFYDVMPYVNVRRQHRLVNNNFKPRGKP